MHNWWIAALVQSGIWTEDQAQHVSDNIKTTIHKENFREALAELNNIVTRGEFDIKVGLAAEVEALKGQLSTVLATLATEAEKAPIAKKKPTT